MIAVVAVTMGVGLGLWMALLSDDCPIPPALQNGFGNNGLCPSPYPQPLFAWWLCALGGLAAAGVVLVISASWARRTPRRDTASQA